MPRLKCTFAEFLAIIEAAGFTFYRQGAGSHKRYRGEHSGHVWLVDIAAHNMNDAITPGTLRSMIKQSGLPKHKFRR